jgi:putative membrane protein
MKNIERPLAGLLAIMYAVGVIGHLIPATRQLMLRLTPFVLLLLGAPPLALAFLRAERRERRRLAAWAVVTYLLTFALEAIGVATGLVFGAYSYGQTLGARLFSVPVVIGFNWLLVVAGSVAAVDRAVAAISLGRRRRRAADRPDLPTASPSGTGCGLLPAAVGPVLAGLLTVLFDWVMEPVAIRLDYWRWAGGAIPIQNYVAWFLIAAAAAAGYRLLRLSLRTWTVSFLVGVQLVFFAILSIGL